MVVVCLAAVAPVARVSPAVPGGNVPLLAVQQDEAFLLAFMFGLLSPLLQLDWASCADTHTINLP